MGPGLHIGGVVCVRESGVVKSKLVTGNQDPEPEAFPESPQER